MSNIIDLPVGVRAKAETRLYAGHRYTLRFSPTATPDKRWSWVVKYTRTYEYIGSAETIQRASKDAELQIRKLNSARRAS